MGKPYIFGDLLTVATTWSVNAKMNSPTLLWLRVTFVPVGFDLKCDQSGSLTSFLGYSQKQGIDLREPRTLVVRHCFFGDHPCLSIL